MQNLSFVYKHAHGFAEHTFQFIIDSLRDKSTGLYSHQMLDGKIKRSVYKGSQFSGLITREMSFIKRLLAKQFYLILKTLE